MLVEYILVSSIILVSDVMTSLPTNESELQLYRVLQRANLLKYYDSFISHGEFDSIVGLDIIVKIQLKIK